MNGIFVALLAYCLLAIGCDDNSPEENLVNDSLKLSTPIILDTLSHSTEAFTQGLFFHNGKLYESAGRYGYSTLRVLDSVGNEERKVTLGKDIFAEGCALHNGWIYQISWRRQRCFVYSVEDLAVIDTLGYEGEGWGLTSDGTSLIMSDGSDTLFFRNEQFTVRKKVAVTWRGESLMKINELEYAHGRVYANVWYNDFIYVINPQTGKVEQVFDCTELINAEQPDLESNVLNGIAWIPQRNLFYCTGKQWKKMFLVQLPRSAD